MTSTLADIWYEALQDLVWSLTFSFFFFLKKGTPPSKSPLPKCKLGVPEGTAIPKPLSCQPAALKAGERSLDVQSSSSDLHE